MILGSRYCCYDTKTRFAFDQYSSNKHLECISRRHLLSLANSCMKLIFAVGLKAKDRVIPVWMVMRYSSP